MLGPTRAATTLPLFLPQSPPDQASGLIDARPCWRSCWGKARPRPDPGAGRSTAARCTPRWKPPSATPTPKGGECGS